MRDIIILFFLTSFCAYAEKMVHPGDTAYWTVHCNGDPVKAKYIDRPHSVKGENLKKAKDTCYFIKKDYFTMRYDGFQPIAHGDKLEFRLKKQRIIPGEYEVSFETSYTPVSKTKSCYVKPKYEQRKTIKKILKIKKTYKDHLLILTMKDLDNFNNWYIQDLEIKLSIKLNDKLVHELHEKFLNWPKCNIYSQK